MENPTRLREPLGTLPVEYWEMDASIYGALADNLSACGVLMLSIRDMPVGTRLYVRIFYANEYELYWITAEASIVSKDRHITEDWKGHKYQLQFVQMSEGNRLKLKDLLNNHSMLEHNPGVQDRAADGSSQGETVPPTFPESDVKVLQPSHCRSYENGKCLKTHAFCDLCQTADEIIVLEMARSAQKSRSRRSKPFTSGLARLAGNFKSAFGNY